MLTQSQVQNALEYKTNGVLVWRNKVSQKTVVGELAGYVDYHGYQKIGLFKGHYKRSQLTFLYHHGYIPKCIDHINNNKLDDRIENLRDASRGLNSFNKVKMANNTSGKAGVTFFKRIAKWRARINVNGAEKALGYFANKEDAVSARRDAEILYYGEHSPA